MACFWWISSNINFFWSASETLSYLLYSGLPRIRPRVDCKDPVEHSTNKAHVRSAVITGLPKSATETELSKSAAITELAKSTVETEPPKSAVETERPKSAVETGLPPVNPSEVTASQPSRAEDQRKIWSSKDTEVPAQKQFTEVGSTPKYTEVATPTKTDEANKPMYTDVANTSMYTEVHS